VRRTGPGNPLETVFGAYNGAKMIRGLGTMYSKAKQKAFEEYGPPPAVQAILADPPTLAGESEREYWGLFVSIGESLSAADAIDWLFVEDVSQTAWTLRQLRNARATLRLDRKVGCLIDKERSDAVLQWRDGLKAAYRIAHDGEADAKRRENMRGLYLEWIGTLIPVQGANSELAGRTLAQMIGHPEAPAIRGAADPMPWEEADALVRAFKSLEGLDEAINRLTARFNASITELERRHFAQAKLMVLQDYPDTAPGSNSRGWTLEMIGTRQSRSRSRKAA